MSPSPLYELAYLRPSRPGDIKFGAAVMTLTNASTCGDRDHTFRRSRPVPLVARFRRSPRHLVLVLQRATEFDQQRLTARIHMEGLGGVARPIQGRFLCDKSTPNLTSMDRTPAPCLCDCWWIPIGDGDPQRVARSTRLAR